MKRGLFKSKKTTLFDSVKPGDWVYYPSTEGLALLAEVLGKNVDKLVLGIDNEYYITKNNFNENAIMPTSEVSSYMIMESLKDPENDLIYIRYRFNKTWIDKLYNRYCIWIGRNEGITKIEKAQVES